MQAHPPGVNCCPGQYEEVVVLAAIGKCPEWGSGIARFRLPGQDARPCAGTSFWSAIQAPVKHMLCVSWPDASLAHPSELHAWGLAKEASERPRRDALGRRRPRPAGVICVLRQLVDAPPPASSLRLIAHRATRAAGGSQTGDGVRAQAQCTSRRAISRRLLRRLLRRDGRRLASVCNQSCRRVCGMLLLHVSQAGTGPKD